MNRSLVPVAVATLLGIVGCRGETGKDVPIVGIRNMYDQPKFLPQARSTFFADERTMRPVVEGTIARETDIDTKTTEGLVDDHSAYVRIIPQNVVDRAGGMGHMLERGRERYNIYCAPCHDQAGRGRGMIAQRAAKIPGASAMAPTNLHLEKVRHMPDGQLFATIANGVRNMPAYGAQLPPADRWAIVAYVRALEVSQASQNPEGATP